MARGTLTPGTLITPSLRLVRPLALGGMASVWIADHLGLDAQVALKFLDPVRAKDPELGERFRREAAMAARVRSVHVVQVLDHGTLPDGCPFILMELLDGCTLEALLAMRGRISIVQTAIVVTQVAKALARAHRAGIVHRDVKPENIFVQRGEYDVFLKLLDFGIAKQIDARRREQLTGTGVGVGTPGYVSPEQAVNAKKVDHRADLWSLGAVAYRAVTGRLPYDCESKGWWTGLTRACQPPSELEPSLGPAVDAWFARALHPVAGKRFKTADEMSAALRAIAEARPTAPRKRHATDAPPSSVEPGQYGLFDEVQTDEGTLIMDDRDHRKAERGARAPSTPRMGAAHADAVGETTRPGGSGAGRARVTTKRRIPRPRKRQTSTTAVSRRS